MSSDSSYRGPFESVELGGEKDIDDDDDDFEEEEEEIASSTKSDEDDEAIESIELFSS